MTAITVPQHRYVALDSLRGICACMVFLCHIPSHGVLGSSPFVKHSWLFVDFFFVLSGFVIGSSYGERLTKGFSISKFMILRFFRVYPLHLAMLAIFLAFEILLLLKGGEGNNRLPFQDSYSVHSAAYSIALLQIFFGPDGTFWNGPAWSIAAEFWTYLIFAWAIALFRQRLVLFCLVIAVVAPIILANLTDRNMNAFHDGALARCLFGFAFGILCWKLPAHVRQMYLAPAANNALEIAAVALVVGFVIVAASGPLSLAAPLVFAIVVTTFSREQGFISKLLLRRPMVAIGTLSYSIYMVHLFLVYRYINVLSMLTRKTGIAFVEFDGTTAKLTAVPWLNALLVMVLFVAVLVTAALSYRWIEEPGRDLGKRIARRYTPGHPPAGRSELG